MRRFVGGFAGGGLLLCGSMVGVVEWSVGVGGLSVGIGGLNVGVGGHSGGIDKVDEVTDTCLVEWSRLVESSTSQERRWRLDTCMFGMASISLAMKFGDGEIWVTCLLSHMPPQAPRIAHRAQSVGPRLQLRQRVERLQLRMGRSICESCMLVLLLVCFQLSRVALSVGFKLALTRGGFMVDFLLKSTVGVCWGFVWVHLAFWR